MHEFYSLGIDFALTQSKRLPVALLHSHALGSQLQPIPILPPYGPGLAAVFDPKARTHFIHERTQWFIELNNALPHPVQVVGFDAPTCFCPPHIPMRKPEKHIRSLGCGIFKTPTEATLRNKTEHALAELTHNPKALRGGFSVWMLLAIEWAQELSQHVTLIEVFPNFFWKQYFGSDHKKQVALHEKQALLLTQGVKDIDYAAQWGQVNAEDAIDAAYCAWVAARYKMQKGVGFVGDQTDAIYYAL